jgi:hypothetical protein
MILIYNQRQQSMLTSIDDWQNDVNPLNFCRVFEHDEVLIKVTDRALSK